jgi:hypothetical protein
MQHIKQVAEGFRFTSSIICLFVTFVWEFGFGYLPLWLGVPLFILLAASFVYSCFKLMKRGFGSNPPERQVKQVKATLMAIVGAGVSCWFLDVLSTFFAVNINQTAAELNPLGWPLSAFVALAYYIPITFAMYYLLYKLKKKGPFYVAVVISIATLFFSFMSLSAAFGNFSTAFRNDSTDNLGIASIWSVFLIVLIIWNTLSAKSLAVPQKLIDRPNERPLEI